MVKKEITPKSKNKPVIKIFINLMIEKSILLQDQIYKTNRITKEMIKN